MRVREKGRTSRRLIRPRARTQLWLNIRFNPSSFCSGLFARAGPSGRKLVSVSCEEGVVSPSLCSRGPWSTAGELDRRLKGRIRARTHANARRERRVRAAAAAKLHFMQIPRTRRRVVGPGAYARSYFGQNIAGRATSILCLCRARVIKCLTWPASRPLCYFAHNRGGASKGDTLRE